MGKRILQGDATFFFSACLTNAPKCRVRKNSSQHIKDSLLQSLLLILEQMPMTHHIFPSPRDSSTLSSPESPV